MKLIFVYIIYRIKDIEKMPFIDYPPLEIGPENSFNYPPSNSSFTVKYSLTTPPRNRARITPSNYPPLEFSPSLRPWRGSFSHTFLCRKQTLASATFAKDLGKLFFIPSYATAYNLCSSRLFRKLHHEIIIEN